MRGLVPVGALVALAACKSDEVSWVEFNATGETLVVEVTADPTLGDDISIDLMSNLGRTNVGTATVSPGSGPVGTFHDLYVDVLDTYEATVGRVTVDVKSEAVADLDDDGDEDSRGEGEFELEHDSADPGAWAITLQSLGATGEERADRFTIVLWQPEQLAPEAEEE